MEQLTNEEARELEDLQVSVGRDLLAGPMSAQLEQFAEVLREVRTESTQASI